MSEETTRTASDGPVTVERSVTVKAEGVIVELEATAERTTTVRVTDELPALIEPNEVGFHPDHSPAEGEATPECVAFEGTVEPGEPMTVVYGAYLDTAGLDVDFAGATLRVDADPTEEPLEEPSSDGLRGYVRGLLGGEKDREPARTASEAVEDGADASDVGELDEFEARRGDIESAIVAVEEGEDGSATVEPAIRDLAESDDLEEEEVEGEKESDLPDGESEPAPEAWSTDEVAADEASTDEVAADEASTDEEAAVEEAAASEPSESGAEADGGAELQREGSVASRLVAELEAGEVDRETRKTLARELRIELSGSESARLDHVQKRVDDLDAYAEPLKDLLDREGRPTEVVRELREDIDDVRGTTTALREELETVETELHADLDTAETAIRNDLSATESELRSELDSVDEQLVGLESGLDEAAADRNAIRDELESTAAELATAREELDGELEALRDEVTAELERVERQAREGRRDLAADLDDLQEVAAQVRSLREALSSAFGMGGGTLDLEPEPATDDPADAEPADDEPAESSDADGADDGGSSGDSSEIESRIREMETDGSE